MIRLVGGPRERAELMDICAGSAFGCKLRAVALAYGFERDFARFWTDGGAAYCLLDGGLSIAGVPADIEEGREFLDMLGPASVFCERELAGELGLAVSTEGAVMAKDLSDGRPEVFPAPGLREVHALLTAAGMPLEFEPFYLDMSHRVRHGAALALGAGGLRGGIRRGRGRGRAVGTGRAGGYARAGPWQEACGGCRAGAARA